MNPNLKNILIRSGCVIGSLCAYLFLTYRIDHLRIGDEYNEYQILCDILDFAVPLLLVWLNLRPLAKPIRQIVVGIFVLTYASIRFWSKVEFVSWQSCHDTLFFVTLGFVLLSSLLPIFLRKLRAERLAGCGKMTLWAAVLWLDFVAAMPKVRFADEATAGIYMGRIRATDTSSNRYWPVYAFARTDFWGFNDTEDVYVMTPADSTASNYRSTVYRHTWGSDMLVDTLACDTIWLRARGVYYDPNRRTMENIEQIRLRGQWQYNAWQKIKRLFNTANN